MANPFSKGWKYLMALFDSKIEEHADPKVQIQQAVEGAKEQHRQISEHAAEIIGRKSQLEMQMNRLVKSQQDYQSQTQRALELADSAEDPQKASEYNQAAEVVASQLVAVEQELEDVKQQYAAAEQAAAQAKSQRFHRLITVDSMASSMALRSSAVIPENRRLWVRSSRASMREASTAGECCWATTVRKSRPR